MPPYIVTFVALFSVGSPLAGAVGKTAEDILLGMSAGSNSLGSELSKLQTMIGGLSSEGARPSTVDSLEKELANINQLVQPRQTDGAGAIGLVSDTVESLGQKEAEVLATEEGTGWDMRHDDSFVLAEEVMDEVEDSMAGFEDPVGLVDMRAAEKTARVCGKDAQRYCSHDALHPRSAKVDVIRCLAASDSVFQGKGLSKHCELKVEKSLPNVCRDEIIEAGCDGIDTTILKCLWANQEPLNNRCKEFVSLAGQLTRLHQTQKKKPRVAREDTTSSDMRELDMTGSSIDSGSDIEWSDIRIGWAPLAVFVGGIIAAFYSFRHMQKGSSRTHDELLGEVDCRELSEGFD